MVGDDEGVGGEDAVVPWGVVGFRDEGAVGMRSGLILVRVAFKERLGDQDHFFEVGLRGRRENRPCFSAASIKAPALVAVVQEDVDKNAIPTANVNEAGEGWAIIFLLVAYYAGGVVETIHVFPELNEECCNT